MLNFQVLVSLALAALTTAAPLPVELETRQGCNSGLYIIGARGSGQTPGLGSVASVANALIAAVPGSVAVAVDYPADIADFGDTLYPESVNKGIVNAGALATAHVNRCGTQARIVLLGYSQGGHVMTGTLAGGATNQPTVSPTVARQIRAITVFGDPTFVAGQSYSAGTSTSGGLLARSVGGVSNGILNNSFGTRLRSYCENGDFVCSSQFGDAHSRAVSQHQTAAINHILARI